MNINRIKKQYAEMEENLVDAGQAVKISTKKGSSNKSLLQIGVFLLAIVSFFTTANGMKEYIFKGNDAVSYVASAAVQSILLALSMNLPRYLKEIWEKKEEHIWPIRLFLCIAAVVLTFVALFCSSWFSYVYIAEIIHKDSWGADSELLVQQTYRSELYDARDYAHVYRIYLEEILGNDILLLEGQSRQLSDSYVDLDVDWDTERETYVANGGTTSASYMAAVIEAVEIALQEGSSQEARDFAATAVSDAKTNITDRMDNIQQNLNTLNDNIASYNNTIADLTRRVNSATEDTDTEALTASINAYTALIASTTQRQVELQTEHLQLDNALLRLPFYESRLGLNSSTSAISIRSELMQLQSEFFRQDPEEERMLEIAADIFENLRNASQSSSSESDAEDALTYTNLLIQMNRLIRNLTEYAEIKSIEAELEDLITKLRVVNENEETEDASLETERAEMGSDDKDGESRREGETENQWAEDWRERLEELKAQISAMPVYSESEEGAGKTTGVLSEAQANILHSYDRNESSKELDDMIRRYISEHNAIYEGIIYLQSPYRSLALFALILAFSFDIAGFVFGIVLQGESEQQAENGDSKASSGVSALIKSRTGEPKWSIIETLNQYMVLTGDFESRDGICYYKVFNNGVLEQWHVRDELSYKEGIYLQEKENKAKGARMGEPQQELLYAEQLGGPTDGIYMNCQLDFNEGALILVRVGDKTRDFIASINEYVPVHSYSPNRSENRTLPAKQLAIREIDAKIAVVALNKEGTRVAAIYIIEQ